MKYVRMLPAAAGILALASTVGLERNVRGTERTESFRINVVARDAADSRRGLPANFLPIAVDSETGLVYFAEVARGETSKAG